MRISTCPWCGKSLKNSDIKQISTNKSFMRFIIARCVHCNKVYGQNYNFDGIWPLIILFIISLILMLTIHYLFVFGVLFSILLGPFMPFSRFDDRFDHLKDDRPMYKLTLVSGRIEKKRYYLTADFDSLPCFSAVSPIEIKKIRKNAVYFCFTYEHTDNLNLFASHATLYDISGNSHATVKFENNGQTIM